MPVCQCYDDLHAFVCKLTPAVFRLGMSTFYPLLPALCMSTDDPHFIFVDIT